MDQETAPWGRHWPPGASALSPGLAHPPCSILTSDSPALGMMGEWGQLSTLIKSMEPFPNVVSHAFCIL